ncbi:tenascin-X [Capsaspora owczarzaki ATCC 30864]|uniref:Tenascin-X n=2 Tax=Capsaspora owczarzaki (strain ATCC 30864) TaxID=595528 RepID=A0A0D2WXQ2_CAPO3|nr:tenascin-X [Capsaspora owczarzaki ATCC 30864]
MQFLPTSHLFCESGRAGSSPSTGMTLVGAGAARSVCGDRKCDATESCESCSVDCGTCRVCGDGFCSTDYETCRSCPHDCGVCPSCGDGVCNGNEHCDTCPNDCGECISCGDKVCNGRETCQNCWADCGACPTCGDGKCDLVVQGAGPTLFQYKETLVSCPLDCEPRNVTIYVIGRPENNSTEEQASRARRREEGMQASRELYEATAYTIKPFDLDPSFSPSAEHHAQLEAEWVELENARVAELKRRDAELFAPKPLSDDEIRELFPAYADAIIAQRMDQEIENELALYNEVRSPALKAHFASHETRQQAARESRAQQLALEARQEREQPKRIIIKHVDLQALHNRRRELPHLHQIFNSMSPPEEGLSYQVDGFVEDFEITEIITQVGSLDLNEPRPEQTVERVVASSDDSSVSSHGRRGVAPEPAAAEAAAAAASHPEDAVEPDATTTSHKIAILTAKQLQFLGVGAGVMLVVGLVSALASYRKHRRTTDIKPASTASPVAAKRSQPSASSVEAAAPEVLPVEKDVTAKDTTRSTVEVEKGTLRVLPGLPQLRESSACSTPEAETDTRRSIPGSSSPLSSPLRAR